MTELGLFSLQQSLTHGAVTVWVPGRPRTKGSLKPVHIRSGAGRCRVSLTESGGESEAWKKTMIATIRAAAVCSRWDTAVRVDALFLFEREAAAHQDEVLHPWPTANQYGDEDKLRRNVLDALTQSGLIKDDALVLGPSTALNGKRFIRDGEAPGAWIRVEVVPDGV